ncbi:MAG TPA: tyrosine--tRNA ligase, partial [Burkholderiales bacterium]|nr:tyrosine--tRNA ligase [Burkholderiales bacterium]
RHGAMPDVIPDRTFASPSPEGMLVTQAVTLAGLSASHSDSARLVEQGGVTVDGVPVSDRTRRIARGTTVTLQVGKRKFVRVTVK